MYDQHPGKGMLPRPTLEEASLTSKQFPWFCVDRYTIKTRDELFKSTLSLINILMNELNKANEMYQPNISETLLIDLLYAALNVPAFGEQQRWRLRKAASTTGAKVRMSPLAEVWPFEVLGRKVGIDEDVVQVRDDTGLANEPRRLTCTEICAHSSITPGQHVEGHSLRRMDRPQQ